MKGIKIYIDFLYSKKKIAYGSSGFPWKPFNQRISYKKGNCKVAEDLHNKTFFYLSLCSYDF